jgi:hypothetical protein
MPPPPSASRMRCRLVVVFAEPTAAVMPPRIFCLAVWPSERGGGGGGGRGGGSGEDPNAPPRTSTTAVCVLASIQVCCRWWRSGHQHSFQGRRRRSSPPPPPSRTDKGPRSVVDHQVQHDALYVRDSTIGSLGPNTSADRELCGVWQPPRLLAPPRAARLQKPRCAGHTPTTRPDKPCSVRSAGKLADIPARTTSHLCAL